MKKIDLKENEIINFSQAAEKMYLPFDEQLQIYAQDDSFLQKKVWDFANTAEKDYPSSSLSSPYTKSLSSLQASRYNTWAHVKRGRNDPRYH